MLRRNFLPAAAILLLAGPAEAHAPLDPEELWRAWELNPLLLAGLALPAWLYFRGTRRVWRRAGRGRGVGTREAACFGAGMTLLALALVTPLHALGEVSFAGHMAQHVALMMLAAPLVALGAPVTGILWGLPRRQRVRAGRAAAALRLPALWAALTLPINAWLLHAVALWLWHAPNLYQATLFSEAAHAAQHASFIATSVVFWASVERMVRRRQAGVAVLFLFTTSLHEGALGALLTFAGTVWYPAYAERLASWGTSAMADQQLGGLIMWIPGGAIYLLAIVGVFGWWLNTRSIWADGLRGENMKLRAKAAVVAGGVALSLGGCEYVKLLRPSVLKQLNPDVVRLVNTLPEVDDPNGEIVARLFAHGGLSRAELGGDGVFRDKVWVPEHEFIWRPAIIHMERGGELEIEFHNEDQTLHAALVPGNHERQALMLPMHTGGRVRVRLDQPGLYWFGCPISNHAGRGMLGIIMVGGDVPPEAKLDRPKQKRP